MQVGIRQAGRQLSNLINQAVYSNTHITITSRGKPKAILLSVKEYERLTKRTGLQMAVLEEARRLREAFADRYGVLGVDLVREAREEREARMASVLASEGSRGKGKDNEPDEPRR
jgi:prevent-host-death family protein